MNATEALYGFVAWLTTRKETVRMGASEPCDVTDLIERFRKANGLPDVTENYPHNLTHPTG